MAFQVRQETRPTTGGLDGTVHVLANAAGTARAEIWPANGFNCHLWQVVHDNRRLDLLYADPQFFQGAKPTRSGIPVLFPFPNRIRGGRFTWQGKDYQLPLGDSSGKNAIHGFACRRPWRVVGQGSDETAAWLTGEFRGSIDAADTQGLWPADYLLRLTYRLEGSSLRLGALVENPDRVPLPFGLGYHPYFRLPPGPLEKAEDCRVQASPDRFWVLDESLPTGELAPVDGARDLRTPRRVADLELDDVLHAPADPQDRASSLWRGSLFAGPEREILRLETAPAFGELVVFTPPHRQAICLEPYTCTTDALNLQQKGVDAGLIVLPPGEEWRGDVTLIALP